MPVWLLSPLGRKVAILLLVLAAAGGIYWFIYEKGADAALERIEDANDEAERAAIDAADNRRDCVAANGVWDFAAARCRRDQADNRE